MVQRTFYIDNLEHAGYSKVNISVRVEGLSAHKASGARLDTIYKWERGTRDASVIDECPLACRATERETNQPFTRHPLELDILHNRQNQVCIESRARHFTVDHNQEVVTIMLGA